MCESNKDLINDLEVDFIRSISIELGLDAMALCKVINAYKEIGIDNFTINENISELLSQAFEQYIEFVIKDVEGL